MMELFRDKGVEQNAEALGVNAAHLFRILSIYMHTNLTPSDQAEADPYLHPGKAPKECCHYEYEGSGWKELAQILIRL